MLRTKQILLVILLSTGFTCSLTSAQSNQLDPSPGFASDGIGPSHFNGQIMQRLHSIVEDNESQQRVSDATLDSWTEPRNSQIRTVAYTAEGVESPIVQSDTSTAPCETDETELLSPPPAEIVPCMGDEVSDCPTECPTDFTPSCVRDCCCGSQLGGGLWGRSRGWAAFDALLWFPKANQTTALITQNPVGTPTQALGIRESATTSVLHDGSFGDGLSAGGRVNAGLWPDPSHNVGVQQEFFALGHRESAGFGGGDEILSRPFFNTNPTVNAPDAQVFHMPDVLDGSTTLKNSSDVYSSATALRVNLGNGPSQRTDVTLGYRFLRLDEEFSSREALAPLSSRFVDGTTYELNDQIATRNTFHGVEFGANHARRAGLWDFALGASVAVGDLRRSASANGSTQIVVPGVSDTTFPGGFFVGAQDIGQVTDHDISVIPQANLNISRALGGGWRLRAGYSFLYLDSAFRPDAVINTSFDGDRLANAALSEGDATPRRPSAQGLWFHGFNAGLIAEF